MIVRISVGVFFALFWYIIGYFISMDAAIILALATIYSALIFKNEA